MPYITPIVEFDPVLGTVPTQYENGRKAVSHKDLIEFVDDIPVNNDDAVYTVLAGEQVKIAQIYGDLDAVGVAARAATIGVVKNIAGINLVDAMVTGAVNLAAGEQGSISMFQSGPTWLNTDGAIANEDTNITGMVLQAADTITLTWTNKQADDRARLQVGVVDLPVI